jgi:hypothetical protein
LGFRRQHNARRTLPVPCAVTHRWSGWPGAWCLDCGIEDPHEIALAEGNYIEVADSGSAMGFHFEFPNVIVQPCPCPNEGRYDPYRKSLAP